MLRVSMDKIIPQYFILIHVVSKFKIDYVVCTFKLLSGNKLLFVNLFHYVL